jgi:hypothetical protein
VTVLLPYRTNRKDAEEGCVMRALATVCGDPDADVLFCSATMGGFVGDRICPGISRSHEGSKPGGSTCAMVINGGHSIIIYS